MNRKSICLFAFAAAIAAVIANASPLGATETDDKIVSSFENTYVYKTYLKDDSVKADAKNGVVTLTGIVSDESHKTLAQETAACLPGVASVDNKLSTKAEAATGSSDIWIARKVKLALLFHSHVSYNATTVEAKDGTVTLKGEASSKAQKELTAEYAKDIDGVKDIKNEMTVAAIPEPAERTASQKIDDASITAQVKTALSTHKSTSALNTKVQTRMGEVTLTGIARNPAEKALVGKLVSDIQGVSGVSNQMTIADVVTK